jgi:hypothetical protein
MRSAPSLFPFPLRALVWPAAGHHPTLLPPLPPPSPKLPPLALARTQLVTHLVAELTSAYTALHPGAPPECLAQLYLDLAWLDALLADQGPGQLRLDIDAAYLLLCSRLAGYQRSAHHAPTPLLRQVGGAACSSMCACGCLGPGGTPLSHPCHQALLALGLPWAAPPRGGASPLVQATRPPLHRS